MDVGGRLRIGCEQAVLGRHEALLDLTLPAPSARALYGIHARHRVPQPGKSAEQELRVGDLEPAHLEREAACPWELPVLGAVAAPTAVVVRPDGCVAWWEGTQEGLPDALTTWFGPPRAA